MPVDPIIIDTSIQAVGATIPNYGVVLCIGREDGGTAADNVPMLLSNLTDVATYFGNTTDIYKAAQMIFAQGVAEAYFVRAINTVVAVEAVTKGSLQTLVHPKVAGIPAPVIAANTMVYTNGVPTDPGASKAMLNPITGKIFVNGVGSVNIAYYYTDWAAVITAVKELDVQLCVMAMSPISYQFISDWTDMLDDYCDTYQVIGCGMGAWTTGLAIAGMTAPIKVFTTKHLVALVHKDATHDVGAALAGMLSGVQPWDKMMWKTIEDVVMASYFTNAEVATIEADYINAVITKFQLDIASNGLTRDTSDAYKYVDLVRTRYYLEGLLKDRLSYLLMNSQVPYTPGGLSLVESSVAEACEVAVGAGALRTPYLVNGVLYKGYTIQMPLYENITAGDKEDRILRNVYITARLTGHIQEITMNLALQI